MCSTRRFKAFPKQQSEAIERLRSAVENALDRPSPLSWIKRFPLWASGSIIQQYGAGMDDLEGLATSPKNPARWGDINTDPRCDGCCCLRFSSSIMRRLTEHRFASLVENKCSCGFDRLMHPFVFDRSKPLALQAIALPAQTSQPQGLLVGLHGWGANAQDLAALAPLLNLPNYTMIFPNAPLPHPYSTTGRMWYAFPESYSFLGRPEFSNQPDLVSSRQQLKTWLLSLERQTGIPLSGTVLAGFSQGGAMTLDVGSTLPLAALMVLSGYMHAPIPAVNPAISRILTVHGRQDQVVPLNAAQRTRTHLQAIGAPVEYHEFDMGHEIRPIVLEIMQNFMKETPTPPRETA